MTGVAAEPTAARHLVQLCDGLPLALRIAAARLASRPTWPVSVLANELADPRRRLDVLTFEDLSVRDALAATYDALAADDPPAPTPPWTHAAARPHRPCRCHRCPRGWSLRSGRAAHPARRGLGTLCSLAQHLPNRVTRSQPDEFDAGLG
jgi:hypothetical protein